MSLLSIETASQIWYNRIGKAIRKGLAVIYRQEIMQDITLFTSAPKANFYDKLFLNLDLSEFPEYNSGNGRPGYSRHALLCAFIVMKCECFAYLTDLLDYLQNNLLIAYYCGFDITSPLPSYWTFERFLKETDNEALKRLMQSQVRKLAELQIIDSSFIALDSTPVLANTSQNNPKSFRKNKFSKNNHPKSDKDCALGVHTATNQVNEKKAAYDWGYKSHVLTDCITGLPIYELTTPANIADSTVTIDILSRVSQFLPLDECTFIADKGYDVKAIYNTVHDVYHGDCAPQSKKHKES